MSSLYSQFTNIIIYNKQLRNLLKKKMVKPFAFASPSLIRVLQQSHPMLLQKDQTTEPNFVLYFCLSEIPACLITRHYQINQQHNLHFDFHVLFSRYVPPPNFVFMVPQLAIMFFVALGSN